MFNPLRLLLHPFVLGSSLMALGFWGIWYAYVVAIPAERAYVREGVEVEAQVTAKETRPWVAELKEWSPVTTRMTADFETEAGPATDTTQVSEAFFERFETGDRVMVLQVPGTALARIRDGAPPSPKLALMGWAIVSALGLGAFMIGLLGLFL
ncbi:MAG: hypothetical protein AAF844_10230 [Pseudomonadota bacterium]